MALKSVLITGCSDGGIGGMLAETFHKRGFHVFATARTVSKMSRLTSLPNATLLSLDVSSRASIVAAAAAVRKQTGGTLDILVNNAGLAYTVPAIDADLERVRTIFDANFFGVVETTQVFSQMVVEAKGAIVNICSTASKVTAPFTGMYAASKAAQEAFSEVLGLEMRPYGVRVLTLLAGKVETNMTAADHKEAVESTQEGSFFQRTEKASESLAMGTPAGKFAEVVVNDILKGATGRSYRGHGGTFVWFMHHYVPQSLQDLFMNKVMAGKFVKA